MCQTSTHWLSIHCILPPHIVRSIILRGDQEQRERALANYEISHTFRTTHVIQSFLSTGMVPGVSSAYPHFGTSPQVQRTIYDAKHSTTLPGVVV